MALPKVFVYGTLKKGEPNYHWITDKSKGVARFLYAAETVKKFPLVIHTKYNIPFLLDSPGAGHNVIGEVYEVDETMLKQLDILEDHPNFYVREIEEVKVKSTGEMVKTWIYLLKAYKPDMLKLECLKEYSSTGPHGLTYLESNNESVTSADL